MFTFIGKGIFISFVLTMCISNFHNKSEPIFNIAFCYLCNCLFNFFCDCNRHLNYFCLQRISIFNNFFKSIDQCFYFLSFLLLLGLLFVLPIVVIDCEYTFALRNYLTIFLNVPACTTWISKREFRIRFNNFILFNCPNFFLFFSN
ncbi:hypothetical protein D1872_226040 [compost metagenome]